MKASIVTSLDLSDLSVVLPYHNSASFIEMSRPSLQELASLGSQLVFVDDFSDDNGTELLREAFDGNDSVRILELEKNGGAGVARNHGLQLADRQYTLFFDIDDLIDVETLSRALEQARKSKCDVQISTYKLENEDGVAQKIPNIDREIFAILHEGRSSACFNVRQQPQVLRLTNYPWNKLILTEFAKSTNFKFGCTRVQNDVFAHWSAILQAGSISFFPSPYTTHIVSPNFNQITNDFGENRLQLFDALEQVEEELLNDGKSRNIAVAQFMAFKTELIAWAKQRIKPEVMAKFESRARAHVLRTRIHDLVKFNQQDPKLAGKYARNARK